jgi:hypothetical protein
MRINSPCCRRRRLDRSSGSPDGDHSRFAETLRLLKLIELARADLEHRLIDDAITLGLYRE